jgi:hypothetical protein
MKFGKQKSRGLVGVAADSALKGSALLVVYSLGYSRRSPSSPIEDDWQKHMEYCQQAVIML